MGVMGATVACPAPTTGDPHVTYTMASDCSNGGGSAINGAIIPYGNVNMKRVTDGTVTLL